MALVVGLVGRIASGKGEVSRFLQEEHGASVHVFSNILRDVLIRLHIRVDRGNLQFLGEMLRREYGEDILVNAMREDIKKDASEVVVVDGIRYPNEAKMVRGFPHSIILFIDAPLETRYDRACQRGTRGEASLTFQEFKEIETRETEKHLGEVIGEADHTINNSGNIDELRGKVKGIIEKTL
ncbi:AAA family ATPase [Candidatus Altiarchaeota archaeon]